MSKIDDLNNKKSDLVADLIATVTVMEEVWNYHPDNPNKKDPIVEYEKLKQIQSDVEGEIEEVEQEISKL
tara:strand:- start:1512 stop:1721 length:210 start_codon:yes stop_codon:yes gene_type:complete